MSSPHREAISPFRPPQSGCNLLDASAPVDQRVSNRQLTSRGSLVLALSFLRRLTDRRRIDRLERLAVASRRRSHFVLVLFGRNGDALSFPTREGLYLTSVHRVRIIDPWELLSSEVLHPFSSLHLSSARYSSAIELAGPGLAAQWETRLINE
ncbi:hypothetical protein BDV93DRAFT_219332 [Ceratobasidium sp. AG-I]|nr:hypothetical protein BDV93DRAFT_219332 [Ceratobasidium sp. AG-I]